MILIGALVLGIVIVVHEWGHLFAAQRLGIPAPVFSVGFGPAVARWQGRDTEYRLAAIPFGGYVLIDAFEPEEGVPNFPAWKRILVFLAGPLANLVFAYLACLAIGNPEFFATTLERLFQALGTLFEKDNSLVGPLGILQVAGQQAGKGAIPLIQFGISLSVSLAVLNLAPIPVLDGGQILIAAIEGLARRPLGIRTRNYIAGAAWILVLGLFVYVTIKDVARAMS